MLNVESLVLSSSKSMLIGSIVLVASNYALPIAFVAATVFLLRDAANHRNYFLICALPSIKKSLFMALLITVLVHAIYASSLIWNITPMCYGYVKEQLLSSYVDRLKQLEPYNVHQLMPGYMIFCGERSMHDEQLHLNRLIIVKRDQDGLQSIVSSRSASLNNYRLQCYNGTLTTQLAAGRNFFTTRFQHAMISFDYQLENAKLRPRTLQARFASGQLLLQQTSSNSSYRTEFYRRVSFMLWVFFLPFITWLFLDRIKSKFTIITEAYGIAGLLFFIMYSSHAALIKGPFYWFHVIMLAYGIPIGIFLLSYMWPGTGFDL